MDNKKIDIFINKELSLIDFNARILTLANSKAIPLLERFKFLCIFSSNLDEYFEVRYDVLKQHSLQDPSLKLLMKEISDRVHQLIDTQYRILADVSKELNEYEINYSSSIVWTKELHNWSKKYFHEHILPVLTPLVIDQSHPMPNLINKSLNLISELEGEDYFGNSAKFAIISIPRSLNRVIPVPEKLATGKFQFLLLINIIKMFAYELFDGINVKSSYAFRITRNSMLNFDDFSVNEFTNRGDLAELVKSKLNSRPFGVAIRIELDKSCPEPIANLLLEKHNLTRDDLYLGGEPINLSRYIILYDLINMQELKYPVSSQKIPKELVKASNIYSVIKKNDIILHHPYDSFDPIVQFINQAALDPFVVSIKQTLYRVGSNSPLVDALVKAAAEGKQVVVVIELTANFDENSNLTLANRLQKAGVIVVYGIMNYKIHSKITLVVRNEDNELVHYAHIGTGNYNYKTAQIYTDYSLFTCQKEIGIDIQNIFNQITGTKLKLILNKIICSPFHLSEYIISLINYEIKNARKGGKAFIIVKVNGLSDETIIKKLYDASKNGVKIILIVRGMCCLIPGIPNISENIRVFSFMGRYLEHERVYYFYSAGVEKVFLSSADWRNRNLHRRIEVCLPIENIDIKNKIINTSLLNYPEHDCLCWELGNDGKYNLFDLDEFSDYAHSLLERIKS